MKKFALAFLLLAAVVVLSHSAEYAETEDGGAVIVLTAEDVRDCEAGGGCIVITQKRYDKDQANIRALVQLLHKCRGSKDI